MELARDGRAIEARMSANRGDQAISLVDGRDEPVQRFGTALTADRILTLQNLDVQGATPRRTASFKIFRAGGAFNLTVQDSTPTVLKVLTANQWCEVMVNDVGAWTLVAFGSL